MRLQDLTNAVDAKVADITTKVVPVQSVLNFSKHLLSFSLLNDLFKYVFSLLKCSRTFNWHYRARKYHNDSRDVSGLRRRISLTLQLGDQNAVMFHLPTLCTGL